MNQKIKDIPFNTSSEEVISLLGAPLSNSQKGEINLLVYSSLVGNKADVLYFVDDNLKLKSLDVSQDNLINSNLELINPDSSYLMMADNRGTANEQWLSFWEDEGFAYIAVDRLPGVKVDRVLYFEKMNFNQFSNIWGGSKFIKSSETPIREVTDLKVQQTETIQDKSSSTNNIFLFGILSGFVLLVIIIFFIIPIIKMRKKKKRPEEVMIENQQR
jgi:hypothetical protein